MQASLGTGGTWDAEAIARFPDVVVVEEAEEDLEAIWLVLRGAVEQALLALVRMREEEGSALEADLAGRLDRIEVLRREVEERAPVVIDEYRERLRQRLDELLPAGGVDDNRLAAEVLLFADRSSIAEELVRLKSHVEQMRGALAAGRQVGRRLDFIIQEINREVNTVGSKASDAEIARRVVEMKSEIEKMREQVQNIE